MAESDHHGNLRRVFDLVMSTAPGDRGPLLDRECRGDPGLRKRVEAMVAAAEDDHFLSQPTQNLMDAAPTADSTGSAAATLAAPLREGPGTRIGPYKLLQLIGEGGFGSVFMAEQEKPVTRKVAFKIIKLGMDTRQVVARFEQERQALAMMDHANIARVLDAGSTETGRPFFVMELVKGAPIVEYCDKNNLSIEDRLELFLQVCNAVQHAHTKGIIHRDIKPSNILVSTQDGRPHTKVIDFGIAKATSARLTEKTLFTEHRQLIGTPEYMSPEQAEGNLDIDTRTDVYSLGVLLYELLTGTTPFSSKDLRAAAYAELQRIIREVEPPKPSTRLTANTDTLAAVAALRRIEPRKLGIIIRGELDWIVMKALEKDRQRRYETASGFAMDVRRYLNGDAVVAAPPSAAYRARKFIRRNRAIVTAGSAVVAALLIGAIAFAWQAKVASTQRDLAVAAQKAEAEQRKTADAAGAEARKQEAEANRQAAIAGAVARFQTDMLAAVDPANLPRDRVTREPMKDKVTVVQAMEAAVKKLDEGSLKDQPLVEAGVRDTIGKTLRGLARYQDAEPNLRKSLELRRAVLPAGHVDIATGVGNLAGLLQAQNKLAEAETLFREALGILRAALPAGHADIGTCLNNLALLLQAQNKLPEAEAFAREALDTWRAALPAGHPEIATGLGNLAMLLQVQGKYAEAEPLSREAVAIRRSALPAGHPDIAAALSNLASVLLAQGQASEAEPLLRDALAIWRAALPAAHPEIATGLGNLAAVLQDQNKFPEAENLFREALVIRREAFPAGHPDIAISLNNLAFHLKAQNKLAEAEPLFREALNISRAALPPGHPEIATSLNNLALLLKAQNKLSEAEPFAREAFEILRTSLPSGHPNVANSLSNLARIQQSLGKTAEARAGWNEAIEMLRKGSPNGSAALARLLWRSGTGRLENKDAVSALPELEEAVTMAERFLPAGHPQLKEYRETLDQCRDAIGK